MDKLFQFQCKREGTLFYYQHYSASWARSNISHCPLCGSKQVAIVREFPAVEESSSIWSTSPAVARQEAGEASIERPDNELNANTALIAAAPDLLEACKEIKGWRYQLQSFSNQQGWPDGGAAFRASLDQVAAAVEKTQARAKEEAEKTS